MRTITTNVYKFAELSESAKENARKWYRQNDYHDFSDEIACLEAIGNIIGESSYEIDAWNNVHVSFSPYVDEDVEGLVNVRLLKWVWNNWIWPHMKGKYYSTPGRWVDGRYSYKHYYSKATLEWNCPLTGFCMDMCLYESYKYMQESIKSGERWNMQDFIEELEDRFQKEWQAEIDYGNSDEYIDDMMAANGYEFYEDGSVYQ